jgi:CubicO group peptidase (beta-lactamase class C family)
VKGRAASLAYAKTYAAYSAERLYQFLASHELIRAPGDSFEYSNVCAGLLGHAPVLRAGASGYENLIRARILDPLRMDDTVIASRPGWQPTSRQAMTTVSIRPRTGLLMCWPARARYARTCPICCASWTR